MSQLDRERRQARKNEVVPPESQCSIPGCTARRKGHGYCNRHLKRFREHGNPLAGRTYGKTTAAPKRPAGLVLEESFRWFMPGDPPAAGVAWLWTGPVDEKGYGTFRFEGHNTFAHRVSYEIFVGPIPDGLVIRHKNDTPLDVNPHNLEVGTLIDNVRDREERGRTYSGSFSEERMEQVVRGSKSGMAKLTEEHIPLIRDAYRCGESQASIAKTFGISQVAVSMIIRRKSWSHVP